MTSDQENAQKAAAQVCRVILGKEKEVWEVMTAILANGHILLEDIPGVGKTTLAAAFSRVLGLDYRRIQFTPDVMPSDLTGFSIYRREEERFVYQPGCVFCNLLLADEINRTSPRTQSALLEVMEEGRVTVEGVTRDVPRPFLVIATENPAGSAGTQLLPEAQIDRFMITLTLGYPDWESELALAKGVGEEERTLLARPVLNREALLGIQSAIHTVFISDAVYAYILSLVTATRNHPYIERGASPRATIAMVKMAKASAWLEGRDYVTPADVEKQFSYVITHRIALNTEARMENRPKEEIVREILKNTKRPSMGEKSR